MAENDEELTKPTDLFTSRQIYKLNLEIANLRKKNQWDLYLQFLPMITTAVAVIGLVLTSIFQFQEARGKEQAKVQDQINSSQEEVFKFAYDKNQTLSRESFLLGRLTVLMSSNANQKDIRDFTANLVQMISDLDMEHVSRDESFPLIALEHWNDYKRHLSENPDDLEIILRQFGQAIRNMRNTNPDYLRTIRYAGDRKQFVFFEEHYKDPSLLRRFLEIYKGFSAHLALMANDRDRCAKMLREFELGLGNDDLSYDIWESDPKNKPCH